jgi:hypothetical protein
VGPESQGALDVVGGVGQCADMLRFEPLAHRGAKAFGSWSASAEW